MKISIRIITNLAERDLVSRAIENKRQQTTLNADSTFDEFWGKMSQGSILEQHIGSIILDQGKQKEVNDAIERDGDIDIESSLTSKDLKDLQYYLSSYINEKPNNDDDKIATRLAEKAHITLQ